MKIIPKCAFAKYGDLRFGNFVATLFNKKDFGTLDFKHKFLDIIIDIFFKYLNSKLNLIVKTIERILKNSNIGN